MVATMTDDFLQACREERAEIATEVAVFEDGRIVGHDDPTSDWRAHREARHALFLVS